jgi:hypothetical protein
MSEERLEQEQEDVEAHGGGGRGPTANLEQDVEAHGGGGRGPTANIEADDDDTDDDVEAHRRRTL